MDDIRIVEDEIGILVVKVLKESQGMMIEGIVTDPLRRYSTHGRLFVLGTLGGEEGQTHIFPATTCLN